MKGGQIAWSVRSQPVQSVGAASTIFLKDVSRRPLWPVSHFAADMTDQLPQQGSIDPSPRKSCIMHMGRLARTQRPATSGFEEETPAIAWRVLESPVCPDGSSSRFIATSIRCIVMMHPTDIDASSDQARTSKIMLNGVSVARRKRLKPASVATWRSLRSPAWAPSPRPTS